MARCFRHRDVLYSQASQWGVVFCCSGSIQLPISGNNGKRSTHAYIRMLVTVNDVIIVNVNFTSICLMHADQVRSGIFC